MTSGPRATLFDLFGTLIDVDRDRVPAVEVEGERRPTTFPRWAGLLEDYVGRRTPLEVLEAFRTAAVPSGEVTLEQPSRLRFRRGLEALGCAAAVLEEAAVVLSRAHMQAIVEATVLPSANRAVVDAARTRGRVAVVSNFDDTATAYAILARHGLLDRLDTVVISEAVGRRKPHPLPIVAALRSLGAAPEDAVFIGDGATADVGAARAAGVRAVLIGAESDAGDDVVRVARLADVPRALGW